MDGLWAAGGRVVQVADWVWLGGGERTEPALGITGKKLPPPLSSLLPQFLCLTGSSPSGMAKCFNISNCFTFYHSWVFCIWQPVVKPCMMILVLYPVYFQIQWSFLTLLSFFFFFLFVVDFVIHWNETAMGLHVFPIPIPPLSYACLIFFTLVGTPFTLIKFTDLKV